MANQTFGKWFRAFIEEKGVDLGVMVTCQDGVDTQLGNIIQSILSASPEEKKTIKSTLVMIDFRNGDHMHYFKHLAQAGKASYFESIASRAFFG